MAKESRATHSPSKPRQREIGDVNKVTKELYKYDPPGLTDPQSKQVEKPLPSIHSAGIPETKDKASEESFRDLPPNLAKAVNDGLCSSSYHLYFLKTLGSVSPAHQFINEKLWYELVRCV